jgi:4-hydroxy-3-methylbut-2-enyl diphosphate reductase IspH
MFMIYLYITKSLNHKQYKNKHEICAAARKRQKYSSSVAQSVIIC